MKVKDNLKEKIKIYENKYFVTYKYVFENGNSYKETVSKWKQRDFKTNLLSPVENFIKNFYWNERNFIFI